MKKLYTILLIALGFAQASFAVSMQWQLPIELGVMQDSVHDTLGPPKETISAEAMREKYPEVVKTLGGVHNEYFYSSGIVARFHNKKLYGITINSHGDYRGWIDYQGKIINGITLADTYDDTLKKLGEPTKVEDEPIIESKDNLNKPVVFPAIRSCYWRTDEYTIQIDFLRQAQSRSKGVISLLGSISTVLVYK